MIPACGQVATGVGLWALLSCTAVTRRACKPDRGSVVGLVPDHVRDQRRDIAALRAARERLGTLRAPSVPPQNDQDPASLAAKGLPRARPAHHARGGTARRGRRQPLRIVKVAVLRGYTGVKRDLLRFPLGVSWPSTHLVGSNG